MASLLKGSHEIWAGPFKEFIPPYGTLLRGERTPDMAEWILVAIALDCNSSSVKNGELSETYHEHLDEVVQPCDDLCKRYIFTALMNGKISLPNSMQNNSNNNKIVSFHSSSSEGKKNGISNHFFFSQRRLFDHQEFSVNHTARSKAFKWVVIMNINGSINLRCSTYPLICFVQESSYSCRNVYF